MEYALDDWFPAGGITAGTSLLVAGPPMTGKYDLLLRLLAADADATVVISTGDNSRRVREDYGAIESGPTEEAVGIVDCVDEGDGANETTRYVSSPENLTQIGVKFTEFFDEYRQSYDRVTVGVNSVSELLMYSDVRQVYQFLQVLTGKIQSAEWLGACVIDPTMHDEQTVNTLQNSFDSVVETRQANDRREFRVRGMSSRASDWTAF